MIYIENQVFLLFKTLIIIENKLHRFSVNAKIRFLFLIYKANLLSTLPNHLRYIFTYYRLQKIMLIFA